LGTWGTSRKHDENMLGTHWEQGRKTKKNSPHPTHKRKNKVHHECMWSLPIGYMKFLFPKLICHHFWPVLMVGALIWGHIVIHGQFRHKLYIYILPIKKKKTIMNVKNLENLIKASG
jgi:hypothetical protein